MALTLADCILHVRDLLNESSAAFFTDAELTRFIQQGTLDISTVARCIEAVGSLTMVTNDPDYSLPTGTIDVSHALWLPTRAGLRKITPSLQGEASTDLTGSVPLRYYIWSSLCYIEPVPNSTANGQTVGIYYSLATQDVTLLPDSYQLLAIHYACYRAKLKDHRYQEATVLYSEYANALALRKVDINARPAQAEHDVKFAMMAQPVGGQGRG